MHVLDEAGVAFAGGDVLVEPVRKWMRAGRGDAESRAIGEAGEIAPQALHGGARLIRVRADVGAHFNHGLMHLRLDPLLQDRLAVLENLLDVRAQFARLRIDDLEFLLDPEGVVASRVHDDESGRQRR